MSDLRSANAESLEDIPTSHFHAVTVRWGLMYMAAPVAALANARRVLLPTGVLVAALWSEPERVPYFTLPSCFLEPYRCSIRKRPARSATRTSGGLFEISGKSDSRTRWNGRDPVTSFAWAA